MLRTMNVRHTTIDSPMGDLTVVAQDGALLGLYFPGHKRRPAQDTFGEYTDEGFEDVRQQLGEYFTGTRRTFDVPLAPRGTEFDRSVWQLLTEIPYGETRTYGDLARQLGDPGMAQAVGSANGRNPISIVVPCHRVVGASGNLTGYAGGLDRKRYLLKLEEPVAVTAGRLF
jgi:methylated-DNA-[protein]-cysteine S-methyltransferase